MVLFCHPNALNHCWKVRGKQGCRVQRDDRVLGPIGAVRQRPPLLCNSSFPETTVRIEASVDPNQGKFQLGYEFPLRY